MALDIDHLRSFVVAAETLSFSGTGDRRGRVQSAISAHIAKLEAATGRRLFDRGRGRSIALTPAGTDLLRYAQRILRLNEEAVAALSPERSKLALRFGITETHAITLLPRALEAYSGKHPAVEMRIDCDRSEVLLARLDAGDLDVVLVTDQGKRPHRTLVRMVPLVWAAGERFRPDPCSDVPLAFLRDGCGFRRAGLNALDGIGRSGAVVTTCASPIGVRAAVMAGLAVTVIPKTAVAPPLRILGDGDGLPDPGTTALAVYQRLDAHQREIDGLVDDIGRAVADVIG